jgi:quercetin dioxygenase-like cupin family protein
MKTFLSQKHNLEKPVSALPFFKGEGTATAIQILKDHQLKEHLTKIPALLLCIKGNVVFENENGVKETLLPGGFIDIEPMVKHRVNAIADSQLLLLK